MAANQNMGYTLYQYNNMISLMFTVLNKRPPFLKIVMFHKRNKKKDHFFYSFLFPLIKQTKLL